MKLSKANAQRLTKLVWRERLKRLGLIGAGVAAVATAVVWFTAYREARSDPTVAVHSVEATVVTTVGGRPTRSGYIFNAQMKDGRDIQALSPNRLLPAPGTHVILAEAQHKSGRFSYELLRTAE